MLGFIGKGILLALDAYILSVWGRFMWRQVKTDFKAAKAAIQRRFKVERKSIPVTAKKAARRTRKAAQNGITLTQRLFVVDKSGEVEERKSAPASSLQAQGERMGALAHA